MAEVTFRIDPMHIEQVNRRLAEMLQVRPEEMIGRSALDFLDAGARLDVEQRWPTACVRVLTRFRRRVGRRCTSPGR